MPEGLNVEVAHKLTEKEDAERRKDRWEEVAEVIEVLVLALAAIATASGSRSRIESPVIAGAKTWLITAMIEACVSP